MLATATFIQLVGGGVWGVIAGALTAFGAFIAFLMLSYIWSEIFGNGLTKTAKFTVFLAVGIVFLGIGGLFAPVALGGYIAVGIFSDDSTPKAVDITFFLFFFGTILFYLGFSLKEFLAGR